MFPKGRSRATWRQVVCVPHPNACAVVEEGRAPERASLLHCFLVMWKTGSVLGRPAPLLVAEASLIAHTKVERVCLLSQQSDIY